MLAVAALGIALPTPGRYLNDAHGIPVTLAVLVASTGLSISTTQIRHARTASLRLVAILALSSAALPLLAWAASRLVTRARCDRACWQPGGTDRGRRGRDRRTRRRRCRAHRRVTDGLHHRHRPRRRPDTGHHRRSRHHRLDRPAHPARARPRPPLSAGIVTRATLRPSTASLSAFSTTGTLALLVLLWQVASQITVQAAYLSVTLALLAFLAGSAALAWLITTGQPPPRKLALALPVAMRDFAVAAGGAATAFGPTAAAPLAIYGVLVLLAGALATRATPPTPRDTQ